MITCLRVWKVSPSGRRCMASSEVKLGPRLHKCTHTHTGYTSLHECVHACQCKSHSHEPVYCSFTSRLYRKISTEKHYNNVVFDLFMSSSEPEPLNKT